MSSNMPVYYAMDILQCLIFHPLPNARLMSNVLLGMSTTGDFVFNAAIMHGNLPLVAIHSSPIGSCASLSPKIYVTFSWAILYICLASTTWQKRSFNSTHLRNSFFTASMWIPLLLLLWIGSKGTLVLVGSWHCFAVFRFAICRTFACSNFLLKEVSAVSGPQLSNILRTEAKGKLQFNLFAYWMSVAQCCQADELQR